MVNTRYIPIHESREEFQIHGIFHKDKSRISTKFQQNLLDQNEPT